MSIAIDFPLLEDLTAKLKTAEAVIRILEKGNHTQAEYDAAYDEKDAAEAALNERRKSVIDNLNFLGQSIKNLGREILGHAEDIDSGEDLERTALFLESFRTRLEDAIYVSAIFVED